MFARKSFSTPALSLSAIFPFIGFDELLSKWEEKGKLREKSCLLISLHAEN